MDTNTLVFSLSIIFGLTIVALTAIALGKDEVAKNAISLLGSLSTKALEILVRISKKLDK